MQLIHKYEAEDVLGKLSDSGIYATVVVVVAVGNRKRILC